MEEGGVEKARSPMTQVLIKNEKSCRFAGSSVSHFNVWISEVILRGEWGDGSGIKKWREKAGDETHLYLDINNPSIEELWDAFPLSFLQKCCHAHFFFFYLSGDVFFTGDG